MCPCRVSTVDAASGAVTEAVTSKHVVAANGPLSSPRMPELPGMESFAGTGGSLAAGCHFDDAPRFYPY